VHPGDLSPAGDYDPRYELRVKSSDFSAQHIAGPGDVLFRSRGPFWSAWAIAEVSEPLVAIAPLFILRASTDIDPGFLAWHIGRPAAQRYFTAEAMGSGVRMIVKPVLAALPIELPPIDIQREVAGLAALASLEERLLARLASLKHDMTAAQLDSVVRNSTFAAFAPGPSSRP
jgi:restriction endonuclease S subunit